MSGLNKVTLIGHLGADPETRRLNSGDPVVNMRIATSETWRDRSSGERKERTEWHNVVIFNEALCANAVNLLEKRGLISVQHAVAVRKKLAVDIDLALREAPPAEPNPKAVPPARLAVRKSPKIPDNLLPDGKLIVAACDLDMHVEIAVPAEGIHPRFAVTANAKMLRDVLRTFKSGTVSLQASILRPDADHSDRLPAALTIRSGGMEVSVPGHGPAVYLPSRLPATSNPIHSGWPVMWSGRRWRAPVRPSRLRRPATT